MNAFRYQILNFPFAKSHLKSFVRCYRPRKPLWMGRAKSKMFVVPPTEILPEDEEQELRKLINNYKTEFKSIQAFCHKEYYLKALETSDTFLKRQEREREELNQLLLENEKENQKIAPIREEYVENEARQRDVKLQGSIAKYIEEREIQKEEMRKEIQKLEKIVETEITPETIDAAIEKALETEVDFNYSLSLDGRTHRHNEIKSNVNS